MSSVIGAQLYTLREYLKTPEDIAKTLRRVRKIGYEAVQLSGHGPIETAELKRILDGEGLTAAATHTPFNRLRDETDAVIDEHRTLHCTYTAIPSIPGDYRESPDGYARFAKEASEVARRLSEAGLTVAYHNHSFELARRPDGRTGLAILYEESDPAYFQSEIDTYWIQHGGGDPADWIRRLQGRADLVHVKDMAVTADRKQFFAAVGEGNLNWPAILDACREAGTQWYLVEQDVCPRDPFDCLAASLRNLRAMGLQ